MINLINLINLIKNKSEKSFNQARQCDVFIKIICKI
jgi:hypothetical protein